MDWKEVDLQEYNDRYMTVDDEIPLWNEHGYAENDNKEVSVSYCANMGDESLVCEHREYNLLPTVEKDELINDNEPIQEGDNFQCFLCSILFSSKPELKRHIESNHTVDEPESHKNLNVKVQKEVENMNENDSGLCRKSPCLRSRKQQIHSPNNEKIRMYECKSCLISFNNLSQYKLHNSCDRSRQSFHKCNVCGNLYSTIAKLKKHTLTHENKEGEICLDCGICFSNTSELTSHISETHYFKCVFCPETFRLKGLLIQHKLGAHKKPFKCQDCGKAYKDRSALNNHNSKKHLKKLQFKCDICKNNYNYKNALRKHIIANHETTKKLGESRPRTLKTQTITKIICINENTRAHSKIPIRAHSQLGASKKIDDANTKCEECNKTFLKPSALRRHMSYKHSRNRQKYNCGVCEKSFSSKQGVDYHTLRSHTKKSDTENKICDICKKQFPTRHAIFKHITTIHLQLKSYGCEVCGKAFKKPNDLRRHSILHRQPSLPKIYEVSTKSCEAFKNWLREGNQFSNLGT